MTKIIIFDVNETVLNIAALEPEFERIFGHTEVLQNWFLQTLQYSLVANVAGPYFDFNEIAGAALEMTARRNRASLSEADKKRVLDGMLSLPAHPDVLSSLERLRQAGFRLATLTNSTTPALKEQLHNAGLEQLFDKNLSVDKIRRFKPAPETYEMAAAELGASIEQICLVSAHPWDVLGAMRAGCDAAFVARKGQVFYPLTKKPDITGADLHEVCQAILRKWSL
ncbi:MAG: haloacid dehalogenase type II [Bryobacteraceae bacterium]